MNQYLVKRNYKRYQVCMEMIQTERNYIAALELILTLFKQPLEDALAVDEHCFNSSAYGSLNKPILNKLQISKLFGKIQPILNVHRSILRSLESDMGSWDTNDVKVGYIWKKHGKELRKVYPPFVNDYDSARLFLDYSLVQLPKFGSFVKKAEDDPRCHKIKLKDLLIKPVQRLPSVGLLLNQILKYTDRDLPDYVSLKEAIDEINAVNTQTNTSRKTTDTCQDFFDVVSQIDGFPALWISSSRTFRRSAEVLILSGDGFFSKYRGRDMCLFLFNDIVAFTKNRGIASNQTLSQSFSSRGTLSRQLSFVSPKAREKKMFKLAAMARVSDFRSIRFMPNNEIFVVKIRSDKSEDIFLVQPTHDTTYGNLYDFFKLLCTLASLVTNKDIRMEELTDDILKDINNQSYADYTIIRQALDLVSNGRKHRSSLRRAVSNVSLGITHGLQKFASRAHLSFINESSL